MHTPVLFTATPGTYGVNAALEQQTLDMSVLVTGWAVPKYIFKYIYFIYFSYTLFIRPRGWRHQWSMVDNAPSLSPYCLLTFAQALQWNTEKQRKREKLSGITSLLSYLMKAFCCFSQTCGWAWLLRCCTNSLIRINPSRWTISFSRGDPSLILMSFRTM